MTLADGREVLGRPRRRDAGGASRRSSSSSVAGWSSLSPSASRSSPIGVGAAGLPLDAGPALRAPRRHRHHRSLMLVLRLGRLRRPRQAGWGDGTVRRQAGSRRLSGRFVPSRLRPRPP